MEWRLFFVRSKLTEVIEGLTKSNLVKDSASYTILNVAEKAIPFLILPIVTRVLTKEEVGIYILYQAVINVLIPVMTLNVDSAVLLNFYKEEKEKFTEYFSNAILLFLVPFFLISIILYLYSDTIANLISFPGAWLIVLSGIVMARFFTQLRQHIWRVNYKIKEYGLFTVGISLVNNGLGLFLILYFTYTWDGLIIGHLVGYLLFSVIALYTFYSEKLFNFKFNTTFIKDAFIVGYPLSLHKLGLWLGNAANRVIIAGILGTAATGSYGIGATFAVIVTMIEDAFNKAFMPYLFEKLKNTQNIKKDNIVKLSYSVYLFLAIISIVLFIIGYYGVGIIFGQEYIDTREFLFPLVMAAMVSGFYKLHVNYIMFTKKTLKITQITVSTGILNILLAYSLTVFFGIIGAAYSLLLTKVIQYILTFYVGNKLIPMPWFNFKKLNWS